MSKKKIEKYLNKYSDFSNEQSERLIFLFKKFKMKIKDIDLLKKHIRLINNIEYKKISFIFYMLPEATPRPRSSMNGKIFYVKNAKDNSEMFKNFIETCDEIDFKITTPCKFNCTTYFPIPSSMNKFEAIMAELGLIPKIGKPDFDNLGKTYSDMIQEHLLIDDSLIFDGRIIKKYSLKPRIEITIEYMEEYDCNYNEKKIKKWKSFPENNEKLL